MNEVWQEPEMVPQLGHGDLQVWRVELGGGAASVQEKHGLLRQCYAVLNSEERERAARMRDGAPRDEFVVGRGCLRRLLGAALEVDPRGVALVAGEHGKLRLRSGDGPAFSVAHSRGVILIAMALAGDVGVDVEYMDARVELLDVARSAFHPGDLERIEGAATQDDRLREFYRCWTRREAVAKADGRGLTLAPEEFCVAGDEVSVAAGWGSRTFAVREIAVGRSHVAAVATSVDGMELGLLDLSVRSPLLYAE